MKILYALLSCLFIFSSCKKHPVTLKPTQDANFKKAEQLYDTGKDSAFYYFNQASITNKDSLTIARSYCYMAIIQNEAGDFFGAQETAIRALKLLNDKKKTDFNCLTSVYNLLGNTSLELKYHMLAVNYLQQSLYFDQNSKYKPRILNNQALAHQRLGQYSQALKIYKQILSQEKDSVEYARFLSNAAKTRWIQNKNYNPVPQFMQALNIRKFNNDQWGLNASYAHLADYYTLVKPDSALYYAKNMYQIAQKLNSAGDQLEALQKLIILSPSTVIKKYFEIYTRMNDSLQNNRNAAKNQFAIVRYESEKSKADNLLLQKDNTEKRYQIIKREVMLASGFLLFISASIIAFLWYKKRQQKMELEKQHAIQENQLKTSKKVHDVVANGLYRVMSEMENQPDIDLGLIIDKIEDLYEKSRDISYDQPELDQDHFNEKISALLTSFATKNTKILTVGNTSAFWEHVNSNIRFELEHVLQEFMVNMKKHSNADTVVIKFEQLEKSLNIFYTDNGVGMAEDKIFNNGLKNTVSRIDGIGGKLNFETKLERGLKIHITFPVS